MGFTVDRFYVQRLIDTGLAPENLEMSHFEHACGAEMVRALYHCLVFEELLATYPADWWHAFKARWFPGWLLARFPARYTEVVAKHKFPHVGKEYIEMVRREGHEEG